MTRCAIYIRKSRKDKDKPSHRLTVQREQLPVYAAAQGWQITLYDDGHASAARGKADQLPQRKSLEADIRAGRVDIILTIELSRLSRDDTNQDFAAWLALCKDHRVKLATPGQIIDPGQTDQWLLSSISGAFSAAEMQMIQRRMKEGRQEAKLAGKFAGGVCPPPYRYDKAQGRPVVDPEQLPRMQRLWSLAETNGCSAIAAELGMPLISVRRAIQEERLHFYQAIRISDEGHTIPCDWQPVMDAQQADRIRQRRAERTRGYSRKRYGGLLSNLEAILLCGYCNRTARSWTDPRRGKSWYGCKAKSAKNHCTPSKMIQQPRLDAAVTTNLLHTLSDPQALAIAWQQHQATDDHSGELSQIEAQLHTIKTKITRLVDAITEGIITTADAKAARANLEAQQTEAEKRRSALLASALPDINWHELCVTKTEFEHMDTDGQRELIAATIQSIKLYNTYAIITYRFPRDTSGTTTSRIHLNT